MPLRRHLLPWDRPLLPQAVAWLAAGWGGDGALDLSGLLVVVPTQQAGRRLREALAAQAETKGQAVFSPRVVTPEALISLGTPAGGIATRTEAQLAWADVLRGIRLEDFRAVFPLDPPTRDFAWACRLAEQLQQLQATLAEGALRMADVAARAGPDCPEAGRWLQLGGLERRHEAALARRGLRDPQAAKIAWVASGPAWPAGVEKIVVLGTPDPLPLAVRLLEGHAARGPVEVGVYGPAEGAETLFDDWGRPLPTVWGGRELDWPEFERRVQVCADPADQAARIVALVRGQAAPEGILAIGVGDTEVIGPLESGLTRAGVPAFNPAGRPRRLDALHALLAALADWAREESFGAAAALARFPDVLVWLGRRAASPTSWPTGTGGGRFSPAGLLEELDRLQARHLPPTLAAALRHCSGPTHDHAGKFPAAAFALGALAELRAALTGGLLPENATAALGEIFAGRQLAADSPLAESAEAWRDTLAEAGAALEKFPGASPDEGWELALEAFAAARRVEDKPAGALELNGWLELLWENAPHLVVAGLNDGRVPDAVAGDVFLPEAIRGRLGLKTNAVRFARDAYLLAALAAWRSSEGRAGPPGPPLRPGGRLDVLVGKVSAAGDPLRPSRLLLRCADAKLPKRIEFLFQEAPAAAASVPWARAWRLQPRLAPPPTTISVTALRGWLACPLRFYLQHVLRMERVDPAKAELDALDFGTLVHAALQELGENDDLRDCEDEKALRDGLLAAFERRARTQFGGTLTLPLLVQFESARQRLGAAARVQALERAAGWRVERVEWKFELPAGGLKVRGKIDRIDRNTGTGAVRVLDYKTSDTAVPPEQAHLGPTGVAAASRPAWTRVMAGGRERSWADLQLPLYRRAVAAEFGADVACGYFNLPKAAGDTGLSLWDNLTPDLQAAAETCAERTAAAIGAGTFWPPEEREPRDDADWAGLFHHGTAASVEWEKPVSRTREPGVRSQKTEAGGRRPDGGSAGVPPAVAEDGGRDARAPTGGPP
jgi:ATP-dependent helicase/nuclease subunit B